MTREEFIEGYLSASGLGPEYRTEDGYEIPAPRGNDPIPERWRRMVRRRVALPCHCGQPYCEGWAMIPDDPELIANHMRFRGKSRRG